MTHLQRPAAGQPRIALASASPRRLELLRGLGLDPVAMPADIDETRRPDEAVLDYVRRMALEKARHGARRGSRLPVLGGDTVVCLGETSFGKPSDDDDARRMLGALAGTTHEVHSAVALIADGDEQVRVVTSRVTLSPLNRDRIDAYVASGEPRGKAGGYAIQGLAACFITHLDGSYSAVVGLPLFETAALLVDCGIDVIAGASEGQRL